MTSLYRLIIFLPVLSSVALADDDRCFEMRTYYANEGKLDALHARFRDHTIPLFKKHGMTNVGYWVPKENPDNRLIYVLAYPSLEARKTSWNGFFRDADWQAAYKNSVKDGKLVGNVESVFLKATDYSPQIKSVQKSVPRLFELRTYTTNEGKLDGLHARFRDHTTKLFDKHGISQFAYWTPVEVDDVANNKLVYLVAHQDEAGRKAAFARFGADPDWKSARKASEEDGPLMIKGGVESLLLVPTPYSPTK